MRHANYGNADRNQHAIVDALRKVGATVAITSGVGDGFPDLVVGAHGRTLLIEVKSGRALLNERESRWHREWKGRPVVVVRNVSDALRAIGVEDD